MVPAENKARKALEDKGLLVLTKGWPDFLVIDERKGTGFALEIKEGLDKLSPDQELMHKYLVSLGLPVYLCKNGKIQNWTGHTMLNKPVLNQFKMHIDVLKDTMLQTWSEYKRRITELEDRLMDLEKKSQNAVEDFEV